MISLYEYLTRFHCCNLINYIKFYKLHDDNLFVNPLQNQLSQSMKHINSLYVLSIKETSQQPYIFV